MTTKANNAQSEAFHVPIDRRRFFKSMALASAGFTLPGYVAEALTLSPIVTRGLTIRWRTTFRWIRTMTWCNSTTT